MLTVIQYAANHQIISDRQESISTCRFAQRVALIKNDAVCNEEVDPKLVITRLKKEIQNLRDDIALAGRDVSTDPLTDEELLM